VVVAATAVVLLMTLPRDRTGPSGRPAPAALLEPTPGARFVGVSQVNVSGTVGPLPPAHSLWCFVVNDDDRWFPYRAGVTGDGRWTATVGIGPERVRSELALDLHVVEAPPVAAAAIEDAIERNPPGWAGLDELPPGTIDHHTVGIVRAG